MVGANFFVLNGFLHVTNKAGYVTIIIRLWTETQLIQEVETARYFPYRIGSNLLPLEK